MTKRLALSMLLAWMIPGAGHFCLGHRRRAAAFFAIVVSMFALGLYLDGALYTRATSLGSSLKLLAAVASMGAGAPYFLARVLGAPGDPISPMFEYGSAFMLTAGLMNLLLVLDCYDLDRGRKQLQEDCS